MNAEEFKKSYVRWSYAVALCIPTMVFGLALCDQILDYDFSRNMYLMSFICCATVLSFLSLTWISILNSKMFKEWLTGESERKPGKECSGQQTQDNRKADLSDIEQCIRKEGFVPVRMEDRVTFKVSGQDVDVFYGDEKLSIVRTYGLDDDVNLDILSKACSMLQMGLIFEVQSMATTPAELDRYFSRHLNLLYHGIERHREFYGKLLEQSAAHSTETPSSHAHESKVLS